jgi:hypothetical protein
MHAKPISDTFLAAPGKHGPVHLYIRGSATPAAVWRPTAYKLSLALPACIRGFINWGWYCSSCEHRRPGQSRISEHFVTSHKRHACVMRVMPHHPKESPPLLLVTGTLGNLSLQLRRLFLVLFFFWNAGDETNVMVSALHCTTLMKQLVSFPVCWRWYWNSVPGPGQRATIHCPVEASCKPPTVSA